MSYIVHYNRDHREILSPEKIDDNRTRYFLDEEGEAWVDIFFSEADYHFDRLWELHPEKRGKIKIMGKEIEVPRWQQSYERPYWFSGMMHEPLPAPEEVLPLWEEAKHSSYNEMYDSLGFNEILINWYEDGKDNIGKHSDDESQMIVGPNGESVVYSMTFQEEPGNRIFRLKPKLPPKGSVSEEERKRAGRERIDIVLENEMVVVMGGLCQKKFTHQVPKTKKPIGRRINVTFRCFKE